MYDITCVGILVADAVVRTVDSLPQRGTLGLYDSLSLYSGGCASNAAIDLAKLGASTAIIGMTGKDGFGSFLASELEKYKVDTKGLVRNPSAGTSASVALIDGAGERTFLHSLGANAVFSAKDVDFDVIDNSKIVFVAGCMLMPRFDGADCAAVLKYAKAHGKITALDTAWDASGKWMDTLHPCMEYIDWFLPSINEAEALSGKSDPHEIAEVFFGLGVGHVAIKLGGKGCYVQENAGEQGIVIPTYEKFKPVDTTGAGDSFCAGFLFGLSRGMSMTDCCRIGNAVGTHCIMATGASTGIPSYAEIEKFMKENA